MALRSLDAKTCRSPLVLTLTSSQVAQIATLLLSTADTQSVLRHAFKGIYAFCEEAGSITAQQDADHPYGRLLTNLKGRFMESLSLCLELGECHD